MGRAVACVMGTQMPHCDNSEAPKKDVVWKVAQGCGAGESSMCEQRGVELIEGNPVLGPSGAFLNPRPTGVVD